MREKPRVSGGRFIPWRVPEPWRRVFGELSPAVPVIAGRNVRTRKHPSLGATGLSLLPFLFFCLSPHAARADTIVNTVNVLNASGITLVLNSGAGNINDNETGGTITNTGLNANIVNELGAVLNNIGPDAAIINTNNARWANLSGVTLNNQSGGRIANGLGAIFDQFAATLTSTGSGTFVAKQFNSTLTSDGTGTIPYNLNNSTLTNDGAVTGDGVVPGSFLNATGATLVNDGAGTNFHNQNGATLRNIGAGTNLTIQG